jgi:endonuclease/exonuclease/phosphatase family metal-dependent hydrolase
MEFKTYPARRAALAFFSTALIVLVSIHGFAQNNVNLRIMAANLNGNTQSYQPFAIRIFQGLKPDVIAIQEFNYSNNAASDFRYMVDTTFGTNFVYYREPFNASGDIPNGIISRWPILASGSWPDAQQSQPNRGFAWAQIQPPGTNFLYVVSVHLLTSSAAARSAEATALQTLIQSNFPTNAWVVLAGDFNTDTRTESTTMTTCDSYLSDFPVPVDDLGNSDTSINRNHPHDYVLPSFTFTNFETATVFPTHNYPNGLVFDSRVYADLSDFSPVQSADSGLAQHMAVMKDFLINAGTNVSGSVPSIATPPHDLSVVQGSNATFTVSANGAAPLAYQWLFGGTNISGAQTNSYSITNVQTTNAGNYSVLITNLYGSITSSAALLTVITSPVITTNPAAQSIVQGGTANFFVTAVGIQPLAYQWLFNGTNISGATINPFSLANVQLTNAGNYSVIVTNIAGSVTSTPAALAVTFASTGSVVVLAGWDVSGQSTYGISPMPPTTNVPVVTVVGLTRGGGVTTVSGAAARTWGGNGFDSTSEANAVTAGDYATFSVAANAGYNISFTALNQYDYKRSNSGPPNGVLQYKIGSGNFTDIANFSYTSTTGASLGPVDLTGIAALQNVAPSNMVTFRLVNYGATASGGNWYIFDLGMSTAPDLAVQGIINVISSAVPASPAILNAPVLSAGQFQMLVTGTVSSNYVVQATTNLAPANWVPKFTNVSPFIFTDATLTAPQKFYRAVVQP